MRFDFFFFELMLYFFLGDWNVNSFRVIFKCFFNRVFSIMIFLELIIKFLNIMFWIIYIF